MESAIEALANEARNSISDYCINTCKAKCCKFGSLILLDENEIKTICGTKKTQYLKQKILTKTKDNHHKYNLEKKPCKNLDSDNNCKIHLNPEKNYPRVCKDFPLFIFKGYSILSPSCEAVQKGLLNDYAKKLEKLGLKQA